MNKSKSLKYFEYNKKLKKNDVREADNFEFVIHFCTKTISVLLQTAFMTFITFIIWNHFEFFFFFCRFFIILKRQFSSGSLSVISEQVRLANYKQIVQELFIPTTRLSAYKKNAHHTK